MDIARTLSLPLSLCVRSTVRRAYCLLNSFARLKNSIVRALNSPLHENNEKPRVYSVENTINFKSYSLMNFNDFN